MSLHELMLELERKGEMYVQPVNFETITAFLTGYNQRCKETEEITELDSFAEWLNGRVGHHCNLSWPWVILDIFSNGDPQVAADKIFDLFREFRSEQ